MALKLEPLHPLFAAKASGIDLTQPLTPDLVDAINEAMDEYAVLVFRGQPLTQAQQMAFTCAFGPLDMGLKKVTKPDSRLEFAQLADISNVLKDGSLADRSHRRILTNMANQLWHSDSSFQKPAARYSMLHSVVNPSWGGETEFADMRAAYGALPDRLKTEIADLEVEHFVLHSRMMLGNTDYTEEELNAIPPVCWPLVRTHAGSGRKLLFIGAHARRIPSMSVPEGRVLLQDLLEHATQPQFVYRHEWEVGDLVIWDNRSVLHRGRRFDMSERRELRRSTTLDADHSEENLASAPATLTQ